MNRFAGPQAWSVDDVRSAENAALAVTTPGALMQHAAAALAASCARVLQRTGSRRVTARRVVLLVGSGNNGGDALWAGARLARRGASVLAVAAGSTVHAEGLTALLAAGGRLIEDDEQRLAAVRRADLIIDGLVGLGARPGLREPASALVAAIPRGASVVAVDLPSGIDPDTGELPGPHVTATVTVTFGAAKPGLLLPPASAAAGVVELVELGFPLPEAPLVERLIKDDVARLWPVPDAGADKYRRGVLGVVAGSAGYPGAAVLAVSGALRAGLGMVRYVGPADATAAVRSAWPEVVAGTGRVQAWLLGSGVNPEADDDQPAAIRAALAGDEPCLVDAGALSVLAEELRGYRDEGGCVPDRSARLLLTPHAGELATLLTALGGNGNNSSRDHARLHAGAGAGGGEGGGGQVEREDVERRPYPHALRAARLTGTTVLLKGATTLVVRPDGRARSQADATSWLATAGAGDVLAGIAGALLAGGLSPFDAGSVAALVHGQAATRASGGGPIVSGDVATHVPATVAALLG
jgi:hydroxyethylthiazole kinase-like uncharacterized protein yjeF